MKSHSQGALTSSPSDDGEAGEHAVQGAEYRRLPDVAVELALLGAVATPVRRASTAAGVFARVPETFHGRESGVPQTTARNDTQDVQSRGRGVIVSFRPKITAVDRTPSAQATMERDGEP